MINTSSNKHFITYSVHIYNPSLATPNILVVLSLGHSLSATNIFILVDTANEISYTTSLKSVVMAHSS